MEQDQDIESFRKGLLRVAKEAADDPSPDLNDLQPVAPEIEAKLLRISLAARPERRSWYRQATAWLRQLVSRPIWIPAAMVPVVATLLFLLWPQRPHRSQQPDLDEYRLLATSAAAPQGDHGHPVLHAPGEEVAKEQTLHARFDHALKLALFAPGPQQGTVAIRPFILRNGQLEDWKVTFEAAEENSFRLYAPLRELPSIGSEQELLFAVGRPDALPTKEQMQAGTQPDGHLWQLKRLRLYVDDYTSRHN